MRSTSSRAATAVEVVAYDPAWPEIYAAERALLLSLAQPHIVALEHIGSTAVPGLRSKPVIDMMAAVLSLHDSAALLAALASADYGLIETGMRNRLFLRKQAGPAAQVFHLHIVERATWDERKERLMRDYLLAHPEAVEAYGALKDTLAVTYAYDPEAYTKAKTAFIQGIVDAARAERGLPPIDVWND